VVGQVVVHYILSVLKCNSRLLWSVRLSSITYFLYLNVIHGCCGRSDCRPLTIVNPYMWFTLVVVCQVVVHYLLPVLMCDSHIHVLWLEYGPFYIANMCYSRMLRAIGLSYINYGQTVCVICTYCDQSYCSP
jgi:hypothetical protein